MKKLIIALCFAVLPALCDHWVYFEAPTPKYIKVTQTYNTVDLSRTFEVFSEDIFCLNFSDDYSYSSGPYRLTSSIDRDFTPAGNSKGSSNEFSFCRVDLDMTKFSGPPPQVSDIYKMTFTLSEGAVSSTTETRVVYDSHRRYHSYSPAYSPSTGTSMAYISVQAYNRHQLWVHDYSTNTQARLADSFSGTIYDPTWGEGYSGENIILFENVARLHGYDYTAQTTFSVVNPDESQGSNDYLNNTNYETMSRPKLNLYNGKILFIGNYVDLVLADFSVIDKTISNPTVITSRPLKGFDLSDDADHVVTAEYLDEYSRFFIRIYNISAGTDQTITTEYEPANPSWD